MPNAAQSQRPATRPGAHWMHKLLNVNYRQGPHFIITDADCVVPSSSVTKKL